jgi:hypothetical protein
LQRPPPNGAASFDDGVLVTESARTLKISRTEPDIFRETAQLHGIVYTNGLFEKFAELLAAGYEARADEMHHQGGPYQEPPRPSKYSPRLG